MSGLTVKEAADFGRIVDLVSNDFDKKDQDSKNLIDSWWFQILHLFQNDDEGEHGRSLQTNSFNKAKKVVKESEPRWVTQAKQGLEICIADDTSVFHPIDSSTFKFTGKERKIVYS